MLVRKSRRATTIALVTGLVVLIAGVTISVDFGGSDSPHKRAVRQLLSASAAHDEAKLARLLSPSADFVWSSSFDKVIQPASSTSFFMSCPVLRMSEAVDVVAVQFDCEADRHSELTVDFAFCGDRIQQISGSENGYFFLSPLPRQLLGGILRRLRGDPPRCEA